MFLSCSFLSASVASFASFAAFSASICASRSAMSVVLAWMAAYASPRSLEIIVSRLGELPSVLRMSPSCRAHVSAGTTRACVFAYIGFCTSAFTSPAASSGFGPTACSQSESGFAGVAVRMRSTCLAVFSAASALRTVTAIPAGSWMAHATFGLAMALTRPHPVMTDSSPKSAQIITTYRIGSAARRTHVIMFFLPAALSYGAPGAFLPWQ